jgi:hypothetical protein
MNNTPAKYIFLAGAPGSKWSSVAKHLYTSPDIDTTDHNSSREFYHSAWGAPEAMHQGAYFDPGMESNLPQDLDQYSRQELEAIFDREFTGTGLRIIKSHIFSNHIDFIKSTWPECAIVLVYRNNNDCLAWWIGCGHFNITYPLYHEYYKDLPTMTVKIAEQNVGILAAIEKYQPGNLKDNLELCGILNIAVPVGKDTYQDYAKADVLVKAI